MVQQVLQQWPQVLRRAQEMNDERTTKKLTTFKQEWQENFNWSGGHYDNIKASVHQQLC